VSPLVAASSAPLCGLFCLTACGCARLAGPTQFRRQRIDISAG